MPTITPCLWFDTQALEAAEYYTSLFPNSSITNRSHSGESGPGEPGTVLTVDFELDGQPFTSINGGPQFPFTEAVSLVINCTDQDEADRYWESLTSGGGQESQCGWCRDRYGLSWQVIPPGFAEIMGDPDPETARRALTAMLGMRKLDVAALRAAAQDT